MRINITAQAKDQDTLRRIVAAILGKLANTPDCQGEKYKGHSDTLGNYGYTWEFVPDEHEPAKPQGPTQGRAVQVDTSG